MGIPVNPQMCEKESERLFAAARLCDGKDLGISTAEGIKGTVPINTGKPVYHIIIKGTMSEVLQTEALDIVPDFL